LMMWLTRRFVFDVIRVLMRRLLGSPVK